MKFILDLIAGVYQPWEPTNDVCQIGDHIVITLPTWINDLEVTRTEDIPDQIVLQAEEHWGEVTGAKYRKDIQIPPSWNNDYRVNVNTDEHIVILYPVWITTIGDDDGNSGNAAATEGNL